MTQSNPAPDSFDEQFVPSAELVTRQAERVAPHPSETSSGSSAAATPLMREAVFISGLVGVFLGLVSGVVSLFVIAIVIRGQATADSAPSPIDNSQVASEASGNLAGTPADETRSRTTND